MKTLAVDKIVNVWKSHAFHLHYLSFLCELYLCAYYVVVAIFLNFYWFIYLKIGVAVGGQRKGFHPLISSQVAATLRTVPGQTQEQGPLLWSPMWVTRSQTLGPSSATFPRPLAGSWISSTVARTQADAQMGCQICRQWFNLLCYSSAPTPRAPFLSCQFILSAFLFIFRSYSLLPSSLSCA